jgi:hypothetical protein
VAGGVQCCEKGLLRAGIPVPGGMELIG